MRRAIGLKSNEPPPPQTPARVVTTWTDTVLHKKGKKSQRGFGGRLVFFSHESEAPIRVDGQLVVYAFDEANRKQHETQPTRRYIFPREQFVGHESEFQLGPSYSVWLPWDEVGGEQKNISLIARFEPYEGSLIVGEQTRHLLPGTLFANKEPNAQRTTPIDQVQLTEHTETPSSDQNAVPTVAARPMAASTKTPLQRMTTTSIRLPKKWKQGLSSKPVQSSIAPTLPTTDSLRETPPVR